MNATTSLRAAFGGVAWLTLALLAPAVAKAQDAQACDDAFELAQREERAGHLLSARAQRLVCANAACGATQSGLCTKARVALDERIPTVVLDVRRGREQLVNVRVKLDGKLLRERLDGVSIEVDPGSHTFEFLEGDDSVTVRVTILEGKKAQALTAEFPARASTSRAEATPTLEPVPRLPATPEADRRNATPWTGIGLITTGAVVGVTGTILGIVGNSRVGDVKSTCDGVTQSRDAVSYGSCFVAGGAEYERLGGAKSLRTAGITTGVLGGVVAVVGIVIVVSDGGDSKSSATARVFVVPNGIGVMGSF